MNVAGQGRQDGGRGGRGGNRRGRGRYGDRGLCTHLMEIIFDWLATLLPMSPVQVGMEDRRDLPQVVHPPSLVPLWEVDTTFRMIPVHTTHMDSNHQGHEEMGEGTDEGENPVEDVLKIFQNLKNLKKVRLMPGSCAVYEVCPVCTYFMLCFLFIVCTMCTICTVCTECTVCTLCTVCTVCTVFTVCTVCTVCTVFSVCIVYTECTICNSIFCCLHH